MQARAATTWRQCITISCCPTATNETEFQIIQIQFNVNFIHPWYYYCWEYGMKNLINRGTCWFDNVWKIIYHFGLTEALTGTINLHWCIFFNQGAMVSTSIDQSNRIDIGTILICRGATRSTPHSSSNPKTPAHSRDIGYILLRLIAWMMCTYTHHAIAHYTHAHTPVRVHIYRRIPTILHPSLGNLDGEGDDTRARNSANP